MGRLRIRTVATALLLISVQCSAGIVSSSWSSGQLQMDGKSTDWNIIPQVSNEDLNGTIAVQNDSDYLYLLIRFKDPRRLGSFARSGLTIWTNYESKKRKTLGFTYKSRSLIEHIKEKPDIGDLPGKPPELRPVQAAEPFQDEIIIHDNVQFRREMLPADGSRGISAAFGTENGIFLFEIGIPLALSPKHSFAIGTRPGQKICVGIECGRGWMGRGMEGMPEPPDGMQPGMRGRPPGGMGGMGGGAPGGRKPPEAGFGKPPGEDKVELWLKLKLAEKP